MLILPGPQVDQALPMEEAIECVRRAYGEHARGGITAPLRVSVEMKGGTMLVMPAHMSSPGAAAVKVVSVVEGNRSRGLPAVLGCLLLVDVDTGQPLALMDAARLTAIRTGASGGVAASYLVRPGSRVVTIIGAGVQARTQLMALASVIEPAEVRVLDIDPSQIETFISDMSAVMDSSPRWVRATCAGEAVRGADVVICATTSRRPVLDGADLSPGAHVTAVGAFTADMQELDPATLLRASKVVVDSAEACWAEAGDLIQPARDGIIDRSIIHAELGEIVLGQKPGREAEDEITVFRAVGLGALDVAVARAMYERAQRDGLGANAML